MFYNFPTTFIVYSSSQAKLKESSQLEGNTLQEETLIIVRDLIRIREKSASKKEVKIPVECSSIPQPTVTTCRCEIIIQRDK